jgi:hypothetical protein
MTTWRMRITCWITEARNKHSEYEYLLLLHCSGCCTNAPQCYVIRTTHLLSIRYLHLYARPQKINNNGIFGHNRSKVSCNQSTCAPITRASVIADVCLFHESMTHVLVSLSHRRIFSDLRIDYGGLEIKSRGDECVFTRGSYQFTVEAVRSPKDVLM